MTLALLTMIPAAGGLAVLAWMLKPRSQRSRRPTTPIRIQSNIGGFLATLSPSDGGPPTRLLCDPHEILVRSPALLRRQEHRVPLGGIQSVVALRGRDYTQLEITWAGGHLTIDTSSHGPAAVEELRDRLLAAVANAEPLTAPRELSALLEREP